MQDSGVPTGKASQRHQPRPSSEHGVAQKVNCPRLGVCLFVRFLSEQSVPDVVNWCVYVCVGVTTCD